MFEMIDAQAGGLDPGFNGGVPYELGFFGYEHTSVGGMAIGRNGVIFLSGRRYSADQGYSQYWIVALDAQGRPYDVFNGQNSLVGAFHLSPSPGVRVDSRSDGLLYVADDNHPDKDRLLLLGRYTIESAGQSLTYPALACHKLNGELDPTFGDNGIRIFAGLSGEEVPAFALAGDSSFDLDDLPGERGGLNWSLYARRIYIAGVSANRVQTLLVCVDLDGAIDWSFGTHGVGVVQRDRSRLSLARIHAGPQGIYLAGTAVDQFSNHSHATVARLYHDGMLDTRFANAGFKDFDQLPGSSISALGLGADGQFYAVGADGQPSAQPLIFSFDAQGEPNSGFNGGAAVTLQLDRITYLTALWMLDGKINVLGRFTTHDGLRRGMLVGRFESTGALDLEFAGGAGWRYLDELPDGVSADHLEGGVSRNLVIAGSFYSNALERQSGLVGVITG